MVRDSLARLDGTAPSPAAAAGNPGMTEEQRGMIRGMVEGLAQRLAEKGGSPEEWGRLVRSYMVLGDRPKAEAVLAQARTALGSDAARVAPVDEVQRVFGLHVVVSKGWMRGKLQRCSAPSGIERSIAERDFAPVIRNARSDPLRMKRAPFWM